MSETGVYIYAFSNAIVPAVDRGLSGVSDAPVRLIKAADLYAYVSTVSLAEYGEEPVHRNLERIEWLERTARQHDAVVEAVAREVPAVPVRLVTVYRDDGQVSQLLQQRRDEIAGVLDDVTGRQEWGVKAYLDPTLDGSQPPAETADAAADTAPDRADRPGTAFLRRRGAQLHTRETARRDAAARADDLHDHLVPLAVDSCRHAPQDPQLTGRAEAMILNAAYLVDRDAAADFAAVVAGLERPGISVELTGPWAPYSFTAVEFGSAVGEVAR